MLEKWTHRMIEKIRMYLKIVIFNNCTYILINIQLRKTYWYCTGKLCCIRIRRSSTTLVDPRDPDP